MTSPIETCPRCGYRRFVQQARRGAHCMDCARFVIHPAEDAELTGGSWVRVGSTQQYIREPVLSAIPGRMVSENNGPTKTVERLVGPNPLTEIAESRMYE